ncbi:MAG: HD domain-containing protein [Candidatus Omnitrophica bacterium]|nr:HD domain-containing protein [Candidatus Omnitrophota bacterium]
MRISYRKELEKAARQMILIHRTETLIKLIIRTIIKNLRVSHAGIFLFDKNKESYILTISKGKQGIKIPSGLVKISKDSPLVKYFLYNKHYNQWSDDFLLLKRIKRFLRRKKMDEKLKEFFQRLLYQLFIYKVEVALPIFFREELLGIFILGRKLNGKSFPAEELAFLSILSSDVAMAIRNASLFEDLRIQLEKNQALFIQTITALAQAIEAKDKYTKGHTERVVTFSLKIAQELKKIKKIKNWEKFKNNLKIAALLHDIGKIGVPEKILNKKRPLTNKDWALIRIHPLIGEEILSPIKDLKEIILAVKHHHERYDGKGYPSQLEGKKIPLMAAIISVADAYDAMTTERPYRKALTRSETKEEISKNSGTQFHPLVVKAFLNAFNKEEL